MVVRPACSMVARALSSKCSMARLDMGLLLLGRFKLRRFRLWQARAVGHVVKEDPETAEQGEGAEHRFGQPFPPCVAPRNRRIFREVAVALGVSGVVEYVDDVGSADGLGIVDAGV